MPSIIVTQPATEPVSLIEAKAHLRVDHPEDDALISALISSARMHAETITRRALVTQQWKLVLDSFPPLEPQGLLSSVLSARRSGFEIVLQHPPLQAVNSVKYIDATGIQLTLASTEYIVDTVSEPARLTPAYGKSWPNTQTQINAVEVTFTCGYGSAETVPAGIKSWLLVRIGSLYEHREEVALLTRGSVAPLPFVDSLLDPFLTRSF